MHSKHSRFDGIAYGWPLDTIINTIKLLGFSKISLDVVGMSIYKKALINRALRTSLDLRGLVFGGGGGN
jgi:hypothetical protein